MRGLARASVAVPVVVVIDDADCLDADLAVALIRGLAGRLGGQVLVVAAAAPDSDLAGVLAGAPGWDLAGALRLFQELLPNLVRVLGPGHPDTLLARSNIARWTGECGEAAEALRLFQELLPDLVRVLGPGHVDTLTTRHNIARWTEALSGSTQQPSDTTEPQDPENAPPYLEVHA